MRFNGLDKWNSSSFLNGFISRIKKHYTAIPSNQEALKGFGLNFPSRMVSSLILSPLTLGPGSGGVIHTTEAMTSKITKRMQRMEMTIPFQFLGSGLEATNS